MSFSDYVAQFRLQKSKDRLIHTEKSVKTIAEELGYKNSQNFIRSFPFPLSERMMMK